MTKRDDRVMEVVLREAAIWINQESSGQSLITATRVLLSSRGDRATVFISVFPEEQMRPAIAFLERSAYDFRKHLATHARMHPVPIVEFQLDDSERNTRLLDEISKKK